MALKVKLFSEYQAGGFNSTSTDTYRESGVLVFHGNQSQSVLGAHVGEFLRALRDRDDTNTNMVS